jgi:hypothetical protein
VIELAAGFVSGIAAAVLLFSVGVPQAIRELRAENRQLRDALRYAQRVVRRDPQLHALAIYLDTVLAEDRGA